MREGVLTADLRCFSMSCMTCSRTICSLSCVLDCTVVFRFCETNAANGNATIARIAMTRLSSTSVVPRRFLAPDIQPSFIPQEAGHHDIDVVGWSCLVQHIYGDLYQREAVGRTCLYHGIHLSLIHISEPTRLGMISYAVFCLKK